METQTIPEPVHSDRVRALSSTWSNERIDRRTDERLRELRMRGEAAWKERLRALDAEWDIDRALILSFAVLGGLTYALSHRWRGLRHLFRVQIGFLALHATYGWCPPMLAMRPLGVRTKAEIYRERRAIERFLEESSATRRSAAPNIGIH